MPEHIHLLITEPEIGTPSTVMQVLKQRTARALLPKKKRADASPALPVWRCSAQALLAGVAGAMALEHLSFPSFGRSRARASE
jgi:hypothetical protein